MRRGYRWIDTGYTVWQIATWRRRFHGGVIVIAGGFTWWARGVRGESKTKREAMDAVEKIVRGNREQPQ